LATEESPLLVDQTINSVAGASSSYDDNVSDMTLSRKVALFLSRYSWYCPNSAKEDLQDAWAYFEHSTLPRYFMDDDTDNTFRFAEPGEKEKITKLYPLSTPETDLADFGVGVGVYFFTLRFRRCLHGTPKQLSTE
jgi:hypothetical protein